MKNCSEICGVGLMGYFQYSLFILGRLLSGLKTKQNKQKISQLKK